jgi:phosphatidylinositol-3-phosphatase
VLTKYYGIGHESNPNYVAMISGQAPNPTNQSDCEDYVDFEPSPAVFDPRGNGQAVGQGCVYPANVPTLADQLSAKHVTWHGYMGDMGNDLTRDPDRCGQPASSFGTGMQDGTQSASATDQYAARHNPFVYFHSVIDSGSCERNVVPLTHLENDLTRISTTPQLSFIVPNLCDDGHDAPCTGKDARGKNTGGLASVDDFLSVYVPKIEASPAFQRDGLLLVLADESDNASMDATSCCGESPGPNSPFPGIFVESGNGQGGGLIGALAIGRCVRAGATDATPYNHYSLLRSLEDLYGVTTGGSDNKGHLGMAGAAGLASFGPDLFTSCPSSRHSRRG